MMWGALVLSTVVRQFVILPRDPELEFTLCRLVIARA
jgi:hypothetical protein